MRQPAGHSFFHQCRIDRMRDDLGACFFHDLRRAACMIGVGAGQDNAADGIWRMTAFFD
jgi:hypothetical protein